MSVTRMICVTGTSVVVVAGFACYTLPRNRETAQTPTLFQAERPGLFGALRQFLHAPGTKPEPEFFALRMREDGLPVFAAIPKGWSTWQEEMYKSRLLFLDQDGFRLYLKIEATDAVEIELCRHIQLGSRYGSIVVLDHLFASDGEDILRIAKHEKGKGETDLTEVRYFDSGRRVVGVQLSIVDDRAKNKTVSDLLAFLRSHYGKYEGLCIQVEKAVFAQK